MFYLLSQSIQDIQRYIGSKPNLLYLVNELKGLGHAYVFGGIIRDVLFHMMYGGERRASDIDIVVDTQFDLPFLFGAKKNSFGGYQCMVDEKTSVNYWKLRDTYAVREGYIRPDIKQLAGSTVFDINSVLFDLTTGQVYERGFINAMHDKKISFQMKDYVDDFPELQALRAYTYHKRLQFKLSLELVDFIAATIARHSVDSFMEGLSFFAKKRQRNNVIEMFNEFSP